MSLIFQITNYFKTARFELKKVTWPSKKDTMRYSLIVVGMSLGVAVFFGILDFVFNIGLEKMLVLK